MDESVALLISLEPGGREEAETKEGTEEAEEEEREEAEEEKAEADGSEEEVDRADKVGLLRCLALLGL